MHTEDDVSRIFSEFKAVADRFCDVVESLDNCERAGLLLKIYATLPQLIQQGMRLPDFEVGDDQPNEKSERGRLNDREWGQLYESLKAKLGDWNLYKDVFDPTRDTEAIHGSLADDIADIYRDVKEGVDPSNPGFAVQCHTIGKWRLLYYSHWGQHAMGALRTIHWLLANEPEFVSFQ